jgi:mannose-6-phosphate isomerase-like protein (cupin superfamily)
MLRRWHRLVVVGVALILGGGCRTVSDEGAMHDLPPPPPGTEHYSDYKPINPFVPSQSGVATRSVYKTDEAEHPGAGLAVEVRDFLVASEWSNAEQAIRGAAVFEVRQGSGEAKVDDKTIELHPGIVFTVSEGEALQIIPGSEPLTFRTWIISPKEKP